MVRWLRSFSEPDMIFFIRDVLETWGSEPNLSLIRGCLACSTSRTAVGSLLQLIDLLLGRNLLSVPTFSRTSSVDEDIFSYVRVRLITGNFCFSGIVPKMTSHDELIAGTFPDGLNVTSRMYLILMIEQQGSPDGGNL